MVMMMGGERARWVTRELTRQAACPREIARRTETEVLAPCLGTLESTLHSPAASRGSGRRLSIDACMIPSSGPGCASGRASNSPLKIEARGPGSAQVANLVRLTPAVRLHRFHSRKRTPTHAQEPGAGRSESPGALFPSSCPCRDQVPGALQVAASRAAAAALGPKAASHQISLDSATRVAASPLCSLDASSQRNTGVLVGWRVGWAAGAAARAGARPAGFTRLPLPQGQAGPQGLSRGPPRRAHQTHTPQAIFWGSTLLTDPSRPSTTRPPHRQHGDVKTRGLPLPENKISVCVGHGPGLGS